MQIAVLTIKDDLHAHLVRHELRTRHDVQLRIIEVDRLSATHHIDWRFDASVPSCRVACDDRWINVEDLQLVWWRRSRAEQIFDQAVYPKEQQDVINNDARAALTGAMLTCFRGCWQSHPIATERAGNKLLQLSIAKSLGFRIPRSLVTQDPQSVEQFVSSLPSRKAIVKTVAGGGRGLFLFAQFVGLSDLEKKEEIMTCPAIYQEYIEGQVHVRLNCFGNRSYAAQIVSHDLDWRPNLNVPVRAWPVPEDLHRRVRSVLDEMQLEMGIVDLKMTPEGEFVWLEVNPQGQFLFLEPLCGTPYTRIFAEYLMEMARAERVAGSRKRTESIDPAVRLGKAAVEIPSRAAPDGRSRTTPTVEENSC